VNVPSVIVTVAFAVPTVSAEPITDRLDAVKKRIPPKRILIDMIHALRVNISK
jgi:hypothetical protein